MCECKYFFKGCIFLTLMWKKIYLYRASQGLGWPLQPAGGDVALPQPGWVEEEDEGCHPPAISWHRLHLWAALYNRFTLKLISESLCSQVPEFSSIFLSTDLELFLSHMFTRTALLFFYPTLYELSLALKLALFWLRVFLVSPVSGVASFLHGNFSFLIQPLFSD